VLPEALPTPALKAKPNWHSVDFISDLHLQASEPETFAAWQRYLEQTPADAVFILGDLFEVWVGDDAATAQDGANDFAQRCQHILQAAAQRLDLYFMHGNRDFLLGPAFATACGMTLLPDPSVLEFDQQRWLLSHGDALCLDDTDYQQFRTMVRSSGWQSRFLAKPLPERQDLARALRDQSEARKASGASYADVDNAAAAQWLAQANASTLIHGHTHRPGDHDLFTPADARNAAKRRRLVLSDWDAKARPARLQVLRLRAAEAPQRLTLASGLE